MKILFTFFLIFAFVFDSYALPLVFKTTKEIKTVSFESFVELVSFDTKNCKQIRIALKKNNLETGNSDFIKGFRIYAVESGEDIFLGYFEGASAVVDAPSSMIKIAVNESGNYKIYVWGS